MTTLLQLHSNPYIYIHIYIYIYIYIRRACDVLAPEDGQRGRPPPPTPFSPTHPRKGRGQHGDGEGTWGGGQRTDRNAGGRDEWRAVEVKKKKPPSWPAKLS